MKTALDRRWWLLLIVLAVSVRLFRLDNPVADWHAFRQADTASVTREYLKQGIDVLRPRYHDLSNIASGLDNPEGYRMVEFPLVHVLLALLLQAIPVLPLVETSRVLSIAASLLSMLALYRLMRLYAEEPVARLAAVVFAVLPYSVFYSRVILPEPFVVATSTMALWTYAEWLRTRRGSWFALSWVSLALALLFKPFAVFIGPVFMVMSSMAWGTNWRQWWPVLIYGLAALPMFWWRNWITQFPEGIPASDWLFNGNNIRLRPAWFRWLFWERLTKLILGGVGVALLPANLFVKDRAWWLLGAWWIGMVAYLIVIATGNVQHDYYQVLLSPLIAASVARGLWILRSRWLAKGFSATSAQVGQWLILSLLVIGGWWQVGGYFNVNHYEYVRAGAAVDRLTPADALVIAPAMGDTHFLFQTNRRGWPLGFDIEKKLDQGASHYVSTALDDETRDLMQRYQVIDQTDEYVIIDLQQPL